MIYWTLFYTFFKIGLFTIGGGYAMIPMIQDEVVAHGWLDPGSLVEFIGISESTPGPFSINIATFVGMSQAGVGGAVVATLGIVAPSFIIIYLIAKIFKNIMKNDYVQGAFKGIRPIVVGLIAVAFVDILLKVYFPSVDIAHISTWVNFKSADLIGIAIGAFTLVMHKTVFKGKSVIWLIVIAALLGIGLYTLSGLITA